MFLKTQVTQRLKVPKRKTRQQTKCSFQRRGPYPLFSFVTTFVWSWLTPEETVYWYRGNGCQNQVAGQINLPNNEGFPQWEFQPVGKPNVSAPWTHEQEWTGTVECSFKEDWFTTVFNLKKFSMLQMLKLTLNMNKSWKEDKINQILSPSWIFKNICDRKLLHFTRWHFYLVPQGFLNWVKNEIQNIMPPLCCCSVLKLIIFCDSKETSRRNQVCCYSAIRSNLMKNCS